MFPFILLGSVECEIYQQEIDLNNVLEQLLLALSVATRFN
jgi:hypothetical protein